MKAEQFDALVKKIDLLTDFLILNFLDKHKTQKEKVVRLRTLGLRPTRIAKILGVPIGSVTKTLHRTRKTKQAEKTS